MLSHSLQHNLLQLRVEAHTRKRARNRNAMLKAYTPSTSQISKLALFGAKIAEIPENIKLSIESHSLKFVILHHFVICVFFVFGTFYRKVQKFPKRAYVFTKSQDCRTLTSLHLPYLKKVYNMLLQHLALFTLAFLPLAIG